MGTQKTGAGGLEGLEDGHSDEGRGSHGGPDQGFIQDFQFGGGDVVCGLTGMGEYTFLQVTPRNGVNSIVVSFC